ncbi:Centrosomal protein of 41 kDa [Aphanomyces cochlioides]|nr:Centrosomal protein of 41 kDa [Aphanomyces cochlioides]
MSLKTGTFNKPKAAMTIMEKRLPQNPKYKDTQSKLNTGNTVNNVRLISSKEFLKRRDETFRRVTPRCVADLFREYEDTGKGDANAPEMVARMVKDGDGNYVMQREASENNQDHTGPRIVSYDAEEGENYDVPYLILDTRPREDFVENRIHRAKSFPTAYLCRDQFLPEMLQFKNQESKLIILYCMDEKLSSQSATLLGQKGFDNIYVLSGGLMEYAALYPDHVEGTPPPKPSSHDNKKPARDLYKSGTALTSTAKSVKSVATRKKDSESDISSVASHQSVAESVISKATERKASIRHGGSRGAGNANFR